MKILFFGDIVGRIGRTAIEEVLPSMKDEHGPDIVVANGENMAHGQKITPKTLDQILEAGIDVVTSGDHHKSLDEIDALERARPQEFLRAANYPSGVPGKGDLVVSVGKQKLLIINLMGRVFMKHSLDCPFRTLDTILTKHPDIKHVLVDFHAEATSEKIALGLYADGRVSALLGTHTHVPTADTRVLEKGSAYVSDVGMVGARDGVLGVDPEIIISNFITQVSEPHEVPTAGTAQIGAILTELDDTTGNALSIKRVDREIEL